MMLFINTWELQHASETDLCGESRVDVGVAGY